MRKRGKYGLNNVIDTCKTGSFLPYFVGNLEWGFLKLQSSRDAAAGLEVQAAAALGRSRQLGLRKLVIHKKNEERIGMDYI